MADFSELPDVVWVDIMKKLRFTDRLNVARCCTNLQTIFTHPSLWYSVEIILVNKADDFEEVFGDLIRVPTERYIGMIKKFGSFIKHLTLEYVGGGFSVQADIKDLLEQLTASCNLDTLIVDVDVRMNEGVVGLGSQIVDLSPLANLVIDCGHLIKLVLRSWPSYPGMKCVNVVTALLSTEKTKSIEKLDLFWESAEDATWVTLNAVTPKPEQMIMITKHFINLQELSLRSTMISDKVIQELTRTTHQPLKKLGVLLLYSRCDKTKQIPDIPAKTWQKFIEHCPDLKVSLTVMTRTPHDQLTKFLKPQIPLFSIGYMRYADFTPQDVMYMTENYHTTLHQLICHGSPENLDELLVAMVTKCAEMNYFVYNGQISHHAVRHLASLRKTRWEKFELQEEHIVTDASPPAGVNHDSVIDKDELGKVFVVAHEAAKRQGEGREQILDDLYEQVSQYLDYKWLPRDRRSFERPLSASRSNASSQASTIPTKYPLAKGWQWK